MNEAAMALSSVGSEGFVEVVDLERGYRVRKHALARSQILRAVARVSFSIARGETFGLVGESGSGKSTIAKIILGAEEASGGEVRLAGRTISQRMSSQDQQWRYRTVQAVVQDPYGSLNPRMQIGDIISEPIRIQQPRRSRADVGARVRQLLDHVGLPAAFADRVPGELSGGQRQRVAIARALSLEPPFLVLDEPVSALDVSIQAQILNLLKDIQDELGLTYLLISHDLAVISFMSAQIGVLYLGNFMERGTRADIIERAVHPYTRALIASAEPILARDHESISGEIPSPIDPPSGCAFHTRCPLAQARCRVEKPEVRELSASHSVACHFPLITGGTRN